MPRATIVFLLCASPAHASSAYLVRAPGDAGGGVVFAGCTDTVSALLHGRKPQQDSSQKMVDGIWTTVHAGGAMPVTPSLQVIFDGGMVLGGANRRVEYARRVGIPVL